MLWIGLGVLYLILVVTFGLITLRNGHWMLFILGFVFPLLWLIGTLIAPTPTAVEAEAAARRPSEIG